eukprot:jgi/Galph1/1697/GphlegSOOS_G369.1
MEKGLLWIDKYRPKTLDSLDVHPSLNENLTSLSADGNLPHLLFYGPSGAGKRTRIHAILRKVYGSSIEKRKVEHRLMKVGDPPKEVELTTVSSTHHIEICPADVGYSDRLIIQEIVKEIASSKPIEVGTVQHGYKVVVLHDVDCISREAQQALRRTMEKYTSSCRIIMTAESATRVMEPIRSRCLGIRVPSPTEEEIALVLQKIAKKENFQLPCFHLSKVVAASERNLRKAILLLEVSRVIEYPFQENSQTLHTVFDWERICYDIANTVISDQNPKQLLNIRNKLYELFVHAIPGDAIFRKITQQLLRMVDEEFAPEICHWAAYYEHGMKQGSKEVFHLEAFLAKVMHLYHSHIHASYSMAFDDEI